jgi:hypothetical protein
MACFYAEAISRSIKAKSGSRQINCSVGVLAFEQSKLGVTGSLLSPGTFADFGGSSWSVAVTSRPRSF